MISSLSHRIVILLALVTVLVFPACAAETTFQPSPLFTGTTLPTPPRQAEMWTPPATKLPAELLSATTALFGKGLPDPRGCEYREIAVGAGYNGVVQTHGWVLPAKAGEQQRFAICWSGLVYPVVTVGQPADLALDIRKLIKDDEDARAKQAKEHPNNPFSRYIGSVVYEAQAIAISNMAPLKVCLLLRLGEGELAEQLWTVWIAGIGAVANYYHDDLKNPYSMLVSDWAWSLFERAVRTHMCGDDRLTLIDARVLTALPLVDHNDRSMNFLRQLPLLLADAEQRVKSARKPFSLATITAEPNKGKRITALIDALNEVHERQWGIPGGVLLSDSPIVQALVKEGADAVEPLLTCMETDTRLIRSEILSGSSGRWREIVPVYDAAYTAVCDILQTRNFGRVPLTDKDGRQLDEMGMRRATVSILRDYWQKNKGVTREERWYRILADDHADPQQWLEVADSMVLPSDIQLRRDGMPVRTPVKPGETPPMSGEPLRKRPGGLSVSELMAQRVDQLWVKENPGSSLDPFKNDACRMALILSQWDAKAALPVLRISVQRARAAMPAGKQSFGIYIAQMTVARLNAGDKQAAADYADWIRGIDSTKVEAYALLGYLEPIWRFPDDPDLAKSADWLFNDPASTWVPLVGKFGFMEEALFKSPLVGVPAFRKQLLIGLADKRRIGTAKLENNGSGIATFDAGKTSFTPGNPFLNDPTAPKTTDPIALRLCDYYAWSLTTLDGTPRFLIYQSEKDRDAVIDACAAFLRHYGDRYRDTAQRPKWISASWNVAVITFPHLGHPATPDEATAGLAIFSLNDPAHTRLWPLPATPLQAQWIALKQFPIEIHYLDPTSGKSETKRYDQDGAVWQAEEQQVDGKWHRYYGFVGRFLVAQVPAEEMEFPGGWLWPPLTSGLDYRLLLPDNGQYTVGAAIPLTVMLRNRKGVDLTVPAVNVQADGRLPGMALHLQFAPAEISQHMLDTWNWAEVPPGKAAKFTAGIKAKTLAPTEEYAAVKLDLRDWFDMSKPGHYRLSATFTDGPLGEEGPFWGYTNFSVNQP